MKKKVRKRSPIVRLIFVILLAGMLFGTGFYAYYKRNATQGVTFTETMGNTLTQIQHWFVQRKQQLNEGLSVTKKAVLVDAPPQEQVKFEFYNSLAEMKVNVSDPIVSSDEVEREFGKQIKVKK